MTDELSTSTLDDFFDTLLPVRGHYTTAIAMYAAYCHWSRENYRSVAHLARSTFDDLMKQRFKPSFKRVAALRTDRPIGVAVHARARRRAAPKIQGWHDVALPTADLTHLEPTTDQAVVDFAASHLAHCPGRTTSKRAVHAAYRATYPPHSSVPPMAQNFLHVALRSLGFIADRRDWLDVVLVDLPHSLHTARRSCP